MPYTRHPATQWSLMLASLMFCACGFAQPQTQPQNQPQPHPPTAANPYPMPPRTVLNGPYTPATPAVAPKPPAPPKPPVKPIVKPAKPSPATAARPASPAAPSLLNQPSQAAKVSLASGKLTIEAHNSSISDILRQVAKAGGMKLNGLRSDERIFGKYGPGAPRAVLSELLNGSGYNVLMAGETPSGTPRELSLSTRTGGVSAPHPQPATQDEDSGDDDPQPPQNDQEPENQEPEAQNEMPGTQPQPAPNGVRTPEQILQELQRMRQQQQQPR